MNCHTEEDTQVHVVTPLLYSWALSKLMPAGVEVYIKCENSQPTGSFKVRGIGRLSNKVIIKEDFEIIDLRNNSKLIISPICNYN